MARFKNHLLVLVGFAIAGMIGAAFGTSTAQAVVATLVEIVNPTSSPVPTQHVAADNPASQALELFALLDPLTNGSVTLMDGAGNPYTVPAGHRLVIESISAILGQFNPQPTGTDVLVLVFTSPATPTATQGAIYLYPTSPTQPGGGFFFYSVTTRAYAETGSTFIVGPQSVSGASYSGRFYLYGHLEATQ